MKTNYKQTALLKFTGKENSTTGAEEGVRGLRATFINTGLFVLACAALTSCGGGGSGDSASLDPLVEDFGIAYVKQPLPEMDTADVREPATFNEGSDLFFRDLASPGARERSITRSVTGGLGDVKDVEASFDGSKLLFALRLPEIEGADPEDQPTWNIWEYEIESNTLRRVIESDIVAEDGQDVAPHYLPDGRIIFSSTRQRTSKAILLDDGKPQFSALDENRNEPAFVLHVMNDDGSDIHQVTFNQSHDLDPVVLETGEVVFSRWDNATNPDGIHLYKMYPDGTNQRLLYGANSHDTGTNGATVQFLQTREMPGGNLVSLIKPFSGNFQGADVVEIDVANYVDNLQAVAPNQGILTGPAQVSIAFNEVRTDDQPSPGGRYNSFYPLWDGTNRALVSWTQCRLLDNNRIVPCTDSTLNDPNALEAPPLYSVFIYEMDSQNLIPVFTPEDGIIYRDAVAAQPRQLPGVIFDEAGPPTGGFDFDPSLVADNVGILNIRSVYDFDGAYNSLGGPAPDISTMANPMQTLADQRPARFLRIVKAVSIPDDDLVDLNGADFGISTQQGMREIIGYAAIEPDGSVRVKVPANVPLSISVLNEDGKRIGSRHNNWLQLRPGEIMTCNGCHDPASDTSHGRAGTSAPLNTGAPVDGYLFPNTQTYFADMGDTMADAHTRLDATALEPGVDIRYLDVWSDAATIAAGRQGTPRNYLYADLDASLTAPVSDACQTNWDATCRTIIHYEEHIHPLWGLDRGANTCTDCHRNTDINNANVQTVPAGQLDLTDGASDLNADHLKSYRELVSLDFEQILDPMGNLVDREEPATTPPLFLTDANGNVLTDPATGEPIPRLVKFTVGRPMRVGNALASGQFFNRFSDPADADHFGQLSPAELKLIAEWLDIGGQYYNNPFDVPP
ncbi:HzsA-related protein [Thiogranum longum]